MPKNTIMDRSPKAVAEYAQNDSLALKDVDLNDIVDELMIRGTEANKLYRMKVIRTLEELSRTLRQVYVNSL